MSFSQDGNPAHHPRGSDQVINVDRMRKKYKQVLLDDLLCDNDKLESFDVEHVECDDDFSESMIMKLTCDILCWLVVRKKSSL